jgi:Cytochrome c554 and c-prime
MARRETVWVGLIGGAVGASALATPISTSIRDFFLGGTQPGDLIDPIVSGHYVCFDCHAGFDIKKEPGRPWAASMMGQSARDPVFYAALDRANADVIYVGDLCLRCHAPGAWDDGRSDPPSGAALTGQDFEGVTCNFCHRLVDPIYQTGNPPDDVAIIAGLATQPTDPHSANAIVDPQDRRRGPFDLGANFQFHQFRQSPFHTRSSLCATCHDVSNPAFELQANGTYELGPLNTPEPTGSKLHEFPMERTYSEWTASLFAQGPVDVGRRFGGNLSAVSSCQDCHMPPTNGMGCVVADPRPNLPQHFFNGGNTWVLNAVRNLYPDTDTDLSDQSVADAMQRTSDMLHNAADLALSLQNGSLDVRITNWTGHKLPTGYPEGRRMWINVQFTDHNNAIVAERGAYNSATALLTTADTKVYEARQGVDSAVANITHIPVGPSFHFAANNTWYLDNRIPPLGFTNAGFAAVQAAPVAYSYADGQNWDDTLFAIPGNAVSATVTVYYQSTSKEYIEFLRDNSTRGPTAYAQWQATGMSAPVAMATGTIGLPCYANCDGSTSTPVLNVQDFTCFLQKFALGCP